MNAHRSVPAAAVFIALAAFATSSCDSWYYKTMKKFGMEKRDILVKRVIRQSFSMRLRTLSDHR